jgi:hypothetical protein
VPLNSDPHQKLVPTVVPKSRSRKCGTSSPPGSAGLMKPFGASQSEVTEAK